MSFNILNYKNYNYYKTKLFCIFFFIFSLIISRFLADFFVVLAALGFIFLVIRNNLKINSKILIYFLIFYIYLVIISIFSVLAIESLKSTIPYIRFIFFIFFINFFLDRASLRVMLYSLIFVYIILLVDGIFQIKTGYNLMGHPIELSGRVSSFFGRHLILGSFVSKTFAVIVFLIFYLNIKHKYFAYLLTIFISTFLVYISRERSALFVFLISLFFSFFLIKKKYLFRVVLIIFFQVFFISLLYQKPLERIYTHTKAQLFEDSGGLVIFSERHQLHYITALRIFKEYPLIGGGPNSFRYLCDKNPYSVNDLILKNNIKIGYENGCNTHPHHLYVQLLSETGILGFSFLLFFYLFICKSLVVRLIKYIKQGIISYDISIFGYYFAVLSPLIPSGNFFNNYYNLLLYFPLTFIILCIRK
jgi:O-antigen ligase